MTLPTLVGPSSRAADLTLLGIISVHRLSSLKTGQGDYSHHLVLFCFVLLIFCTF